MGEYESLSAEIQGTSSTLAPWIVREQEFFESYGLSRQHVKMIAGMGMMIVLMCLCSKKLRDTQLGDRIGLRQKVITEKLQPPCYDEVVRIENNALPSYWQVNKGETLH